MSIENLKSELSKLAREELLDVLQFGLEVMKGMEESDFETSAWLKKEIQKRAQDMKSGNSETYSWDDVKNYTKASNG
jgi:hypothetical protein